jgi:hypothetical protein
MSVAELFVVGFHTQPPLTYTGPGARNQASIAFAGTDAAMIVAMESSSESGDCTLRTLDGFELARVRNPAHPGRLWRVEKTLPSGEGVLSHHSDGEEAMGAALAHACEAAVRHSSALRGGA